MNMNRSRHSLSGGRSGVPMHRQASYESPISFEASLRNPSVTFSNTNSTPKRGWNVSSRVSHNDYKYLPPVPSRIPKRASLETIERTSKTPLKVKPSPNLTTRSSVEVTTQRIPANGITIQTMQTLKNLVDDIVHKLMEGSSKFDSESLNKLAKLFSKATREQVNEFSAAALNHSQTNGNQHSGGNSSSSSLYQSLLWCVIFQASIDILSSGSSQHSFPSLIQRAWGYTEKLKNYFVPFIQTSEAAKSNFDAQINQNQSNVRACEVEVENIQRPQDTDMALTEDTFDMVSPPIPPRPRRTHSCHRRHHSSRERCCHKTPKPRVCFGFKDEDVGASAKVELESRELTSNSVEVQTLPEMVNVQTQSSPPPGEEPSPVRTLEDEYKSLRIELANEASRYLSVFRKCQNLQRQLINNSKGITNPFSLRPFPPNLDSTPNSLGQVQQQSNFSCYRDEPVTERYMLRPVETTESMNPLNFWLPKSTMALEGKFSGCFRTQTEAVCEVALRTPLLSLADIQWYFQQARRSNSSRMEGSVRRVIALPCNGRSPPIENS